MLMTMQMWMSKMRRKRKTRYNSSRSEVHSFRLFRSHTLWGILLVAALTSAVSVVLAARAQAQRKPSPNDCLLYSTVFTPDGHALPGADARIHPVERKKPLWELTSDNRGEFAARVPSVGDYEIEVKAKGYIPQTKRVATIVGDRVDLVFNMVAESKKKP
jgi:carboxypeptidase family protein